MNQIVRISRFAGIFLLSTFPVFPLTGIPYRAAYQYGFGNAYSADVDLPKYKIIDLGKGYFPMAVNDQATVLLWQEGNRLVRWTCGEHELLRDPCVDSSRAYLNEKGVAVAYPRSSSGLIELIAWGPGSTTPVPLDWSPTLLSPPISVRLHAFNDLNQLILQIETMSAGFPIPPTVSRLETSRVHVESRDWDTLSIYDYTINMDFSLQQGGQMYEVMDSNNLGDTIGAFYADSAYTAPMGHDPIYAFQEEFFAYNADTQLNFEPLQINDARTILGRTLGPEFGLVIVDSFGQRQLGPYLSELATLSPSMSNPDNGFEEIVIANHYWKRMNERNLAGQPTGQPSPDFWQGSLDDLTENASGWKNLNATCISANGRIAGTGKWLNPQTRTWESHAFLLYPPAMIPDWDRSGTIDDEDRMLLARGNPWRFWINDDNDHGDLAGSHADDLPGSEEPDCSNPGMDGLRDAVDFFPLLIDLQPLLQSLQNTGSVEITLRQEDAAVNFIYSNLLPDEVGELHYMRKDVGFGPAFSLPPQEAPTHTIGPDPVSLNQSFLENIRRENRGVIFLECTKESTAPLIMDVSRNGLLVLSFSLPLSIGPVRDMFRIINLRRADPKFFAADAGPWATDTGDPPNLPDAFFMDILQPLRTLVHIHGYNWGGDEIPAAHAELFKRFHQSGSNARFIGVTWFGDQGKLELTGTTFDYNENVVNAFISARYVFDALLPFSGPQTSIFAHSLGNVVASSCLVDFGLEAGCYFMVNAAVPNEAYLGEQDLRRLMVHPVWKDQAGPLPDYPEFLLSPNWSNLFPNEDRRSFLRWKNRFSSISNRTICLNFYSSGEDILAPGTGDLPSLFDEVWNREQIWTYNEMLKGTTSLATSLTGDIHGGWGFNHHYMDWMNPGGGAHPPSGYWEAMPPDEASYIPQEACQLEPFFRVFSTGDSDFPAWDGGGWLYEDSITANGHLPGDPFSLATIDHLKNHAKILGEAIPAHSFPAGSTALPSILLLRNIDIDKTYRDNTHWPARHDPDKEHRWLHSDYLNPALSHVGNLYRECVKQINYMP